MTKLENEQDLNKRSLEPFTEKQLSKESKKEPDEMDKKATHTNHLKHEGNGVFDKDNRYGRIHNGSSPTDDKNHRNSCHPHGGIKDDCHDVDDDSCNRNITGNSSNISSKIVGCSEVRDKEDQENQARKTNDLQEVTKPEVQNEYVHECSGEGSHQSKIAKQPEVPNECVDEDTPEVEIREIELRNNQILFDGETKICGNFDESLSSVREKKQSPSMSTFLKVLLTVCNCFLASIAIGYLVAMGVMFVAIIDDFKTSRAETSPIISVFTGIVFAGGGVVGPLMNRYNGGYICMVGGVLGGIGCIISSFAPSIPYLIVGTGVLTGFGLAVAFILPYITAREIFDKHRATMLTVIGVSPGIGTVIFPYMTSQLIQEFGWRGVFLIYAGIVLHCVPIGYLNAVVKRRYAPTSEEATPWREVFNCSLFKKPRYLVLVLCVFLMNTLFPTINFFFVDMSRGKGFDVSTSSAVLSINGFSNIAARVVMIFVKPFIKFPLMSQWAVYVAIMSVCVSLYVFADTYPYLLSVAILFGMVWGITVVTYPAMLLEISGAKRFASAMGYCNLVGGIGGLIGAPASGAVKDATGSYDLVYFSTTTLGLISSCLLTIISIQTYLKQRRSGKNDNSLSTKPNNVPFGEINPAFSEECV